MTTCVVCPEGRGRRPFQGQVCDGCKSRLSVQLLELPELLAEVNVRELVVDERVIDGRPVADPVATLLPAASIPSRKRQRVSGTSERSTPVSLTAVDLSLSASSATVHDPFGDQHGELSVATILWSWVGEITECLDLVGPRPAVAPMAEWLEVHLNETCLEFPAVADFAAEVRRTRSVLRAELGLLAYDDELKQGVQCPKCDTRAALHQANGSVHIECGVCAVLLTVTEYNAWVKLLVSDIEWHRKQVCPRCEQRRLYSFRSDDPPRPVWCGWCDNIKGRDDGSE